MSTAFILLLIPIAILPASALFDGIVIQSLIGAVAAIAVAFVRISARAADVNLVAQVTRHLKLAAAVPAIWMIIQILPTPIPGMSPSIWANANDALNQQAWGHVSVDIGLTIEALIFYLANITLIVVGIFVCKDRRRAELLLLLLIVFSILTIVALLIEKWRQITGLPPGEINEVLSALSAIGVILSLTAGVRAIERYESNRADLESPKKDMQAALALCGSALLICIVGLAASATLNIGLVVALSAITFGSVQAIRRSSLTGGITGIFVMTMIVSAVMIIFWRYDPAGTLSPFLQFATASSPDVITLAQRILSDTGWPGTGAGTFAALAPIYQEFGSSVAKAPTSVSAFAIELGWAVTLFTIVATIALVVVLYRGALTRGRDSFYPAAAMACAMMVLGEAFCDASLLHSSVAVVVDAVVGLGLAQSVSRGDGNQF